MPGSTCGTSRPRGEGGPVLGPHVAGLWYPAGREALAAEVDRLLGTEPDDPCGPPRALIVPHAGYAYSGPVAASVFRRLRGLQVERVLLLGPSHYAAFRGVAFPSAVAQRTPLGDVPIDAERIAELRDRAAVRLDDAPFGSEHCLEAELPFLQRTLAPGWRALPGLVGAVDSATAMREVAEALRPLSRDAGTLVVVSSDFTHFGPRFRFVPFLSDVRARIERLDMGAIERILAVDAEGFRRYCAETGATICGRAAIEALLWMLPQHGSASLVSYETSGRITGDWEHSVSYAGLTFDGAPA